ncbi:putative transmembrane protein, partial [Toxoplasma gondii MAS]
ATGNPIRQSDPQSVPQLQVAAACFISVLLSPLYLEVETLCKILQLKLAVLGLFSWFCFYKNYHRNYALLTQ